MRFLISLVFLAAFTSPAAAHAGPPEQPTRLEGQGTMTGPSASGVPEEDSTIAGMCDNCAILAGSNSFADCTNPKCRDSILRGAMGETREDQTDKKKSK